MSEQDHGVSESELEELRSQLCKELEAELKEAHKSTKKIPMQPSEKLSDRLSNRTNIDVFLISLGFFLFVVCLFLPAYNDQNGYETLFAMHESFLSNWNVNSLDLAFLGNLLLFFCPFLIFLKQPIILGVLTLVSWVFCVNATVVYFAWPDEALITNYLWFLANLLITCGYAIRAIKYCDTTLNSIFPQILSIFTIALLIPGISLSALSLEGSVQKEKIFEASRSMILEAVVSKSKQDASPINQDFANTSIEKAKEDAGKMFDDLLEMYGFTGDSIKGNIKVHSQDISILGIVNQSFKTGHGIVAFILLFFSVIVPIVKANLILVDSLTHKLSLHSAARFISKWSMADVFAMSVVFFCVAANYYKFEGLVGFDAKLGIGFYYFVAFCVVSIASSQSNLKKLGAYLFKPKTSQPIKGKLVNASGFIRGKENSKSLLFGLYASFILIGGYIAYHSLSVQKNEELSNRCLALTDPVMVPFEKIDTDLAINACQQALFSAPDSAKYHALLGRAFYAERNYNRALSLFKVASEKGDPVAQTNLGRMYESGDGTPIDVVEALKWFRRAAEQKYAMAQNNLGGMYEFGKGVDKDPTEAMKWYRKAAEQGDAFGQNKLGNMYDSAYGYLTQNDTEAVKWYRMAAEQGYAFGQLNLGAKYEKGEGVAQSFSEAIKWYKKAAQQGNARAEATLGVMYYNGNGVPKKLREAVKLFRSSAERGNSLGQLWLGFMYAKGEGVSENDTEAVEWYRKAAEQENPVAQFRLGLMYFTGEGVTKDESVALKWYRKSAENGNANAQYNLAEMYLAGKVVPQDYAEAFKLFTNAAQQGHAAAQGRLGFMHCNGFGVAKNEAEGSEWYRKAGIMGDTKSQISLGWMYFDGKGGLRKDPVDAVIWFRKAAEQGDAQAQYIMGIMSEKGLGVDKSSDAAIDWYRKAVERGHDDAQAALEKLL